MNAPLITTQQLVSTDQFRVDPRAAFLIRAAARWTLFDSGVLSLDQAFDGLIESCECDRENLERWERLYPPKQRRRA